MTRGSCSCDLNLNFALSKFESFLARYRDLDSTRHIKVVTRFGVAIVDISNLDFNSLFSSRVPSHRFVNCFNFSRINPKTLKVSQSGLNRRSMGQKRRRERETRENLGKPVICRILHPQAHAGLKLNGLDDSENLQQ
ncbi:hypothetical protein B0H11DRAFT_1938206 [Mycena galericulata]|nr:hypothetical protein B0H11DRAFT_1938206 [Mycena galericulata]